METQRNISNILLFNELEGEGRHNIEEDNNAKEQSRRAWTLFETDDLGSLETKIAGEKTTLLYLTTERQVTTQYATNITYKGTRGVELPIQSMVPNWEVGELLRSCWKNYNMQLVKRQQAQLEEELLQVREPASQTHFKTSQVESIAKLLCNESSFLKDHGRAKVLSLMADDIGSEVEGGKDLSNDFELAFRMYRYHGQSRDYDAAPVILTKALLEKIVNCCGKELQTATFLNMNHEGLSSLGEGVLSTWCPKTRSFAADMNRLSNLNNAFIGYEETLEQLSLKDNLISDISGLECLHNLQTIHLDGNSILELIASNCVTSSDKVCELRSLTRVESQDGDKGTCIVPTKSSKCIPASCWPCLKEITLSCNRISKVERLSHLCPKLEVLDLGSNYLASLGGTVASALEGLTCLRVLDVGQNRLRGRNLWESLNNCPLLVSLVASRNRLTELPTHSGSVFLRELWLNGNSIKCFTCTAWMPSLQRLYLQDNDIDTISPIGGFPVLEVLDLSFNKISRVQQLQKLGCFPNLRSLQLNDNPVSELPDYVEKVLEAVPWLMELDNEALSDYERHQAVRSIFLKVMNVVGHHYIHSKIWKGSIPILLKVDVLKQQMTNLTFSGLTVLKCHADQLKYGIRSCESMILDTQVVSINKLMAGDADIPVLWEVLADISQLYCVNYYESDDMCKSYTFRQYEAQWNQQAFQLMCLNHRQKMLNGLRESNIEEEIRHVAQDHKQMGYGKVIRNCYASDLEHCLWEHIHFDESQYEEKFEKNEAYQVEIDTHLRRIRRLQALSRGFLSRRKFKCLLFHQKNMMCCLAAARIQASWKGWKIRRSGFLASLYLERQRMSEAALKIQAIWRGFRTRKRFRLAMEISKYEDPDGFAYVSVHEAGFFFDIDDCYQGREACQEDMCDQGLLDQLQLNPLDVTNYQPVCSTENQDNFSVVSGSEHSAAGSIINNIMLENEISGFHKTSIESNHKSNLIAEKYIQTVEERKTAMAKIAEDWGFTQEKTAMQLLRALENTRRRAEASKSPIPDSQARFKAFIAKCGKKDGLVVGEHKVPVMAEDGRMCKVLSDTTNPLVTRSKSSVIKSKETMYTTASVKVLSLDV